MYMEPIYQQDFEITDLYVDCFGPSLCSTKKPIA